jgi:peroxiredoxin
VSVEEGESEVADFIQRHGLAYPFLMDRAGEISTSYGVITTPTTYFIAPDGTIADELVGTMNLKWLEGNINDFI